MIKPSGLARRLLCARRHALFLMGLNDGRGAPTPKGRDLATFAGKVTEDVAYDLASVDGRSSPPVPSACAGAGSLSRPVLRAISTLLRIVSAQSRLLRLRPPPAASGMAARSPAVSGGRPDHAGRAGHAGGKAERRRRAIQALASGSAGSSPFLFISCLIVQQG